MATRSSILLYDAMTVTYALSVLLYFIDFLQHKRMINRIAFGLLSVVWLMQTVFFLLRMKEYDYLPVLTHFETLIFFSWILITFSLVINFFYKIDLFTFFANVVGFAAVALDTFTGKGAASVDVKLQGDLLFIHITIAFLSYAAFAIATIFSIMYLIQEKLLKEKRWNTLFRRLPALDQLDMFSFRLIVIGFPLLLIAMILGAIWYKIQFGRFLFLDPKPLVSLLLFVLYGLYLYFRVAWGWVGRKSAWLNILGFSGVLINYLFVGTFFSGFHRW
ncbi:protein HemX [Collibacillus ludicampi]|jgi:HemX protein|uniref:Protein HemX n=1 Tax=Collibacillus ludicampi TaxID=2771369 RepID=A0AAV4LAC6_9BACL|nr:cytochrome c biogenesis protein CcsA [Collibacillus ludicampi]GIM44638.1 protein HemX [Collibacillus ludicampi]